ncbi:hypothetical protein [Nocardiopsis lambiniae]|uniref:Uncharacterized protein n=1 Tax=Nocardiopsis lambiniae TaxID=3075539 RepID=A0ABU2M674_9ACTN|nr:hypothetical protein [Nocardiopsis sp. DSM 44743]MDT0328156.1 hypothetical protein [Nocardiopsis sp. DSM 44743]
METTVGPNLEVLPGVLSGALITSLPLILAGIVALVRASRATAPGLVRTAGLLFIAEALVLIVYQALWAVMVPVLIRDPDLYSLVGYLGLAQGVLAGLLLCGGLLALVLALRRSRVATPAGHGGHGGYGGYGHGSAGHGGPVYHGDPVHHDGHGTGDGRDAPPAHGQPGDPGAAPSSGGGRGGGSSDSGGGWGGWGGWGGGSSDSGGGWGGGWGGGDSGGGSDGGGGGGGGD